MTIIPFNFGKEIKMSIRDREDKEQEYRELNVTLKLKVNIAELARILSICYNEYPTPNNEMLNKFLSKQVTKIVQSLAADPPGSEDWPDNFKRILKNMLNEETESEESSSSNNNKDLK
jgi:hypothetical protein